MSEQTPTPDQPDVPTPDREHQDPDADPDNLSARDLRDVEDYDGDPDADPGNMNPREG